jgi:phosphatidate cytidylyltransferase
MLCAVVLLAGGFWILAADKSSSDFEISVLVAFLIVIFARQMFRPIGESTALRAIAYTVFGLFYIPWLFSFISKLIFLFPRAADGATTGQYYVLFLVMVTKFSDMGAYVFGSLFGRHPFAPHISPKKTWEGFFGAMALALLAATWLYAVIPDRLSALRFDDVVILGVLLGIAAVVGDLAESVVKRSTHAKDSSRLLPGIGGTLDLIDSLLFTAPLMYFYLRFVIGVG